MKILFLVRLFLDYVEKNYRHNLILNKIDCTIFRKSANNVSLY